MNAVSSGDTSWMLTSSAFVLITTPGLTLFYGGIAGRKDTVNTVMSSVFIMDLASILQALLGFSLSFSGGARGIIGDFSRLGMNFTEDSATATYVPTTVCSAVFQIMFAIITPALITGALIGRMCFSALFVFIALRSVLAYYLLAHTVWGGDCLMELDATDFAGGTVVYVNSGVSTLVAAIWLDVHKETEKEVARPHSMPLAFLGVALLWPGWSGFNADSASATDTLTVRTFTATNAAYTVVVLSWILTERLRTGKTTLVGVSTEIAVSLVAIASGVGFVPIWASLVIGALVSPICYLFTTVVKPRFGYDDPLDTFGCRGIGGVWDAIATGIFAVKGFNPDSSADVVQWNSLSFGQNELFVYQLIATGIALVISLADTGIAPGITQLVLKRIRVVPEEEALGLDVSEHGEPVYPVFDGADFANVGFAFTGTEEVYPEKASHAVKAESAELPD